MSNIAEIDIQHVRIKIHDNSKPADTQSGRLVEVSVTTVTGDKFILQDNIDDQLEITGSTPIEVKAVEKYNATHQLLAGNKAS